MAFDSFRRARVRDFALTGLGAACLALAALFVAGRIWFRGIAAAALNGEPLVWAAGFLAAAVVLGILHAIAPAPLPGPDRAAYKGVDGSHDHGGTTDAR